MSYEIEEHAHHPFKIGDRFEITDDFESPSEYIGKQGTVRVAEGKDPELPEMVGAIIDGTPEHECDGYSYYYACMLKPL